MEWSKEEEGRRGLSVSHPEKRGPNARFMLDTSSCHSARQRDKKKRA